MLQCSALHEYAIFYPMQAPTHLITGVLIEQTLRRVQPVPLRAALTLAAGVGSHMLLDQFSRFTYHPPRARPDDPIWLSYHVTLLGLVGYLLGRYADRYPLGMFAAFLPDLDWVAI